MPEPLPGHSRQRQPGTRNTPETRIGYYSIVGNYPGQSHQTRLLRPSDWGISRNIAEEMAKVWERAARDKGDKGFAVAERQHRALTTHWLPLMLQLQLREIAEIRPQHLELLEQRVIATNPKSGGVVVREIYTLMRAIKPGQLNRELVSVLTYPPALPVPRTQASEALPADMIRAIIHTARKLVTKARRNFDRDPPALPTEDQAAAFFILLVIETGQSPDVLKRLTFDSHSDVRVTDWGADPADSLELKWRKNRGGASGVQRLDSTSAFSGGRLMRSLRDVSLPMREAASRPKQGPDGCTPWLYCVPDPLRPGNAYRTLEARAVHRLFTPNSGLFRRWLENHDLLEGHQQHETFSFRRLRVNGKAIRLDVADKEGMHLVDLANDNTAQVFADRYTQSEQMMRLLGGVFLNDIAAAADGVARRQGPTILRLDGSTCNGAEVDARTAISALSGDMEAGLTACRDPHSPPVPTSGSDDLCGLAFRACFTCANAVVTPAHVRRMRKVLEVAEEARRRLSPPEWAAVWSPTVDFIAEALTILAPDAKGTHQLPGLFLDIGLRP